MVYTHYLYTISILTSYFVLLSLFREIVCLLAFDLPIRVIYGYPSSIATHERTENREHLAQGIYR